MVIDVWLKDTVNIEYIYLISLLLVIGIVFNSLTAPLQNFLISIYKEKNLMFYNLYFLIFLIPMLILSYKFIILHCHLVLPIYLN